MALHLTPELEYALSGRTEAEIRVMVSKLDQAETERLINVCIQWMDVLEGV